MGEQKVVFGPILSRRLGYSLGIDLVPHKVCNMDCIYCEVGKTTEHIETRQHYYDFDLIIKEIAKNTHEIDCITFSGSGEPTLHSDLDKLITLIKQKFNYPVVLITNSLLLRQESVRNELRDLDIIIPSLDAVYNSTFYSINHPVRQIDIDKVIEGLALFKKEFKGKMWLEILLCKGINDSKEELLKMKDVLHTINPDKVQLNTVVRFPTKPDMAVALNRTELMEIARLLGNDLNVEVLGSAVSDKNPLPFSEEELLSIIRRRRLSLEEICNTFTAAPGLKIRDLLLGLEKRKIIKKEIYKREIYFSYILD